ncbi:prolipoprotein diacylglyceryl transferase [Candidatus Woesearchaeota archaeon]|nr:MAG: prolipoprotein diacylglyceryl transferase [Candidatus Woesearchaeota archaeon]
MFIHNINPVLVSLGPLQIRYYGLVYVIGFLLAHFILIKLAEKKKIQNLTKERVENYIIFLILFVLIGARLFEVLLWEPSYYFANPSEIIKVWHGGLSFHGGLVFGVLWTIWYCRKYKIKFFQIADILVIPMAIMLFFGRIANFINGELWGTVTNAPWAVNFNHETAAGELVYRHPSQLYEALKNLFIFGVLFGLKKKKLPDGFLFWMFVALYGYLRFIVNFWRVDVPIVFGFSVGQIMSLVMGIAGTIMLVKLWRK